jgi:transposase
LAQRERFHIHFTPTYASWINQVERWFGIITERAIRRGSFRSVKELVAKIEMFVANYRAPRKINDLEAEGAQQKTGSLPPALE